MQIYLPPVVRKFRKPVSSLRAGDQVVEGDGALLTVASVATIGHGCYVVNFERYGVGAAPVLRCSGRKLVMCLKMEHEGGAIDSADAEALQAVR